MGIQLSMSRKTEDCGGMYMGGMSQMRRLMGCSVGLESHKLFRKGHNSGTSSTVRMQLEG